VGCAERRDDLSKLEGSIVEVFVGLDWGEQHHQVHALDGGGGMILSLRVPHDRSGLEHLRVDLAALGAPPEVGVAIERREGLLVDHLLAWGHPVYPVNPKVAARAREGYRAAPVKSDVLDAFALADLLRRQVTSWRPQPCAARVPCMLSSRRSSGTASGSSSSTVGFSISSGPSSRPITRRRPSCSAGSIARSRRSVVTAGGDQLAGYDGTFDFGGRVAGLFDEIVGEKSEEDHTAGILATVRWAMAVSHARRRGIGPVGTTRRLHSLPRSSLLVDAQRSAGIGA
jgi:hypothetical protein